MTDIIRKVDYFKAQGQKAYGAGSIPPMTCCDSQS
jgi:hypothetical protein